MTEHRPTKSDKPWREIAEKVSTEQNPNKIAQLSEELIKALDKEQKKSTMPERDPEQSRQKAA
jgi:hypothetical protein